MQVNGSLQDREYDEKSPQPNPLKALLFNGLHGRNRNWGGGRRSHQRQPEKKSRSKPQVALTANIPAVGMHDVLSDRQAKARPTRFARPCLIHAVKALKDPGQMLIGD